MHTRKSFSKRRSALTLFGSLLIALSAHACSDDSKPEDDQNRPNDRLGHACGVTQGDCGGAYCCSGICQVAPCSPGQNCYRTTDCNAASDSEHMVCVSDTCKIKTGVDELSCASHNACLSGVCQANKCVTPGTEDPCLWQVCGQGRKCVVEAGTPKCVDSGTEDPCAGITCSTGQMCSANPSTGAGVCHTDCSKIDDGFVWSWEHFACIPADIGGCERDADCEIGYVCDTYEGICVEGAREFRFVRIDDLSPVEYNDTRKEDPGVDIDAVALKKKDTGAYFYAVRVAGYARGDGSSSIRDNFAFDPHAALGKPDAFVSYPTNTDTCHYYVDPRAAVKKYTFVSLGGLGGWLILEMGAAIEAGDILDVLEVSDCKLASTMSADGMTAVKEPDGFRVQISTSEAANGKWNVVNQGTVTKGILSTTITNAMVNL